MDERKLLFGGLDPALRTDNTSFCSLELRKDGVLEEYGLVVFPHIHPQEIGDGLEKINKVDRHVRIGYDRLGTGEMVKLFPDSLRGILWPVVSSMPEKQNIIGLLKTLWDKNQLIIHDERLYTEILEQERYVSEAGNILYRHPQGFHDDRFWSLGYAAKAAVDYIKRSLKIELAVVNPTKTLEGEITELMMKNI